MFIKRISIVDNMRRKTFGKNLLNDKVKKYLKGWQLLIIQKILLRYQIFFIENHLKFIKIAIAELPCPSFTFSSPNKL